MSDLKKAAAIQGLLIVALWVAVAVYYPLLPERVASHFGPGGTPDGWMTKKAFAAFTLTFPIVLVIILLAVQAAVGSIARLPTALINMPNKHYWLAPERRDETLAFIGPLLSKSTSVVGTSTIALVVVISIMALHANLSAQPQLGGALPLVLAFLAVVIGYSVWMTVKIYRRFGRIPAEASGVVSR